MELDFNTCTVNVKEVMYKAMEFARQSGSEYVEVEHVLYGMLTSECVPKYFLLDKGITKECVARMVEKNVKDSDTAEPKYILPNGYNLNNVIEKCIEVSGNTTITTLSFLFVILNSINDYPLYYTSIYKMFEEKGFLINSKFIKKEVKKANEFNTYTRIRAQNCIYEKEMIIDEVFDAFPRSKEVESGELSNLTAFKPHFHFEIKDNYGKIAGVRHNFLDNIAKNISLEAAEGKYSDFIGRDKEIKRVINILSKKIKNSPVLIGEAGVGKTAIVEGLANKIANGDVPYNMKDKVIYSLNMNYLVAGTRYRGDFEARVKNAIDEVLKAGNIILFIDEIHTIVGAGGADGALDAANMLKPLLARGQLQIIGATTFDEYRKSIEKDSALERRFQRVDVHIPDKSETFEILKSLKEGFEDFHEVSISDPVIKSAIDLSEKYITERNFPDKAIDVIDEACASCKTSGSNILTYDAVKTVISMWKNVKVSEISTENLTITLSAKEKILEEIFDQNLAVDKIIDTLYMSYLGVTNTDKPLSSFLLIGETGVGKTYLGKLLAKYILGDERKLIKLDMSEYRESHSVSKIVGSPPGYIGFESTSGLTEMVRRNPSSIVLFDEIDKAHPDVLNLLLQILDEGRLTDSNQRIIDFKQTIIICTANSASYKTQHNSLGFGSLEKKEDIIADLKNFVKQELLDRFDDVIVLNKLGGETLKKIAEKEIKKIEENINSKGYSVHIEKDVAEHVMDHIKGNDGARRLKSLVDSMIAKYIMDNILANNIMQGLDYVISLNEMTGELVTICKDETVFAV